MRVNFQDIWCVVGFVLMMRKKVGLLHEFLCVMFVVYVNIFAVYICVCDVCENTISSHIIISFRGFSVFPHFQKIQKI